MSAIILPTTDLISANNISAGATDYAMAGCTNLALQSTEANANMTWRTAGTFSNLDIKVFSNTVTAASTLNFRKNTANGNETVSIPASTSGEFRDSTNTDSVVSGDIVDYKITAGGTGTTLDLTGLSIIFSATSGTVTRLSQTAISALSDTSANTTTYFPPVGLLQNTATEANTQFKVKSSFTLQNLYVKIATNARATATTFGSRINGTNGNLVVSVPATTTGVFEDTTHTDSLVSGNLFNYYITTVAGVTSITIQTIGVELANTSASSHVMACTTNGFTYNANITRWCMLGGGMAGNGVESNAQLRSDFIHVASNLECFVITNTVTAASTIRFRQNTANGNQVVSIGASTTGYFEDTTNTDIVAAPNEINYQITTGASGTSLIVSNIGYLTTVVPTAVKWGQCAWSYPI